MAGENGSRLAKAMAKAHVRCFLCRRPILIEEQAEACERVLEGTVPSRVEYAHGECAEKEGLWEDDDRDEDRPRGR